MLGLFEEWVGAFDVEQGEPQFEGGQFHTKAKHFVVVEFKLLFQNKPFLVCRGVIVWMINDRLLIEAIVSGGWTIWKVVEIG